MTGITTEEFLDGLKTNVNDVTERKGDLTYLSWVFAEAECRKRYPNARFETTMFTDTEALDKISPALLEVMAKLCYFPQVPYLLMPGRGYMIRVTGALNPGDVFAELWFPILIHAKKSEPKPDMNPTVFTVNTAIMRAKTKLISMMTGVGLYIYAGEDLPDSLVDSSNTASPEAIQEFQDLLGHWAMKLVVRDNKSRNTLITEKYNSIGWNKSEMKKDTEKIRSFLSTQPTECPVPELENML